MRRRLLVYVSCGAAVGLVGVSAGAAMHALAIAPVWTSMLVPLPFAVVAGAVMAWALDELRHLAGPPRRVASGVLFGALVWAGQIPVTLVEVALRETGLRTSLPSLEVPVELATVVGTGLAAGWLLTGSLRITGAITLSMLTTALALGGAIPISTSVPAALFFLSFLPVLVVCGGVLGTALDRLRPRSEPTAVA